MPEQVDACDLRFRKTLCRNIGQEAESTASVENTKRSACRIERSQKFGKGSLRAFPYLVRFFRRGMMIGSEVDGDGVGPRSTSVLFQFCPTDVCPVNLRTFCDLRYLGLL